MNNPLILLLRPPKGHPSAYWYFHELRPVINCLMSVRIKLRTSLPMHDVGGDGRPIFQSEPWAGQRLFCVIPYTVNDASSAHSTRNMFRRRHDAHEAFICGNMPENGHDGDKERRGFSSRPSQASRATSRREPGQASRNITPRPTVQARELEAITQGKQPKYH